MSGEREVLAALEAARRRVRRSSFQAAEEIAAGLETYTRAHHRWGNPYSPGYVPTGNLEASIHGDIGEVTDMEVVAQLTVGMWYGAHLEIGRRMAPKYAWIRPGVQANIPWMRQVVRRRIAGR